MIKNNKGAILVVTIVSMMILTIIGYVTLQMVSNQNVMDTYYQTKIRVDYAAEGILERARGYIRFIIVRNSIDAVPGVAAVGDVGAGRGFIDSVVGSAVDNKWFLLEDAEEGNQVRKGHIFDNTMHPPVFAGDIFCEQVNVDNDGITAINTDDTTDPTSGVFIRTYRIVVNAFARVDAAGGSEINSTVSYYFQTEHRITRDDSSGVEIERHETTLHSLGWRKS